MILFACCAISAAVDAQCTDYTIAVGGGTAPSEIHWELVDFFGTTVAMGDAPENTGACLPDGCYTMYLYDDANDGWNGGSFTITYEGTTTVLSSGTLGSGGFDFVQVDLNGGCSGAGCSDHHIVVTAGSAPADVFWEITDQFGNLITSGTAPTDMVVCIPDGCYSFILFDNFGDGWNGAVYTVTDVLTSTVESTGTLSNGSFGTVPLVLGTGCGACDGYTLTVTAGSAPVEVYWEFYGPLNNLIASGNAPVTMQLCLPPGCYSLSMYDGMSNGWNGATYTFTANATSTIVASGTLINSAFGTAQVSLGGGCSSGTCSNYSVIVTSGAAPAEVSWNLMSMGINFASGTAPANVSLCLDTGCYIMQLYDAGGNGWNGATWSLVNGLGATVSTGTLSSGSNDAVAVPVGSTGPCTVPQVITASDCPQAVNVCTDLNFTIDPNGWGSVFEIPALGTTSNPDYLWSDAVNSPWGTDHYGCLRGQEINTTWMIVNISGSGSLEFTLGANGSQTGFYDWTMFLYTATTCDLILSNTISPIRCNWNFASYGGTGLVSAIPPGGVPENFEPPLNVLAGQRFLICFSNWSSVTSVVPLVFGGTATVSCDPVILPVELIDLGVAQNAYGSDVHWISATEHNTSHYVVERSVDLWSWVEVGRVTANGSTTQAHHYHLLDPSPMEGDSYYRLRIVDMDGSATTSWIVTARWESPLLRVWPDPSDGEVSITLKEHAEKAVIHVIDDLGRETRFERSASAPDVIRLRLLGAPSGVYSIRVIDGDWQGSGSLIIDAR